LVDEGVITTDDLLIITIGEPIGQSGGTNTMKIVRVVAKPRAGSKAAGK